jgi:hypothetical protein
VGVPVGSGGQHDASLDHRGGAPPFRRVIGPVVRRPEIPQVETFHSMGLLVPGSGPMA